MKKVLILFACLGFLSMQVFAQRTVTGTVTSADDGVGLPGVSVLVKGTQLGTITDLNGTYTIDVPDEANTLIFQFMGMKTTEVEITGDVVSVALENSDIAIDDVVVTALGISKEKKALGYSVQNVSGSDLNKVNQANIVNSLAGNVAGVQVTSSSGAVGSSSRIILRGSTSITGNNEPLFVVDGIPIDNTSYGTATSGGGFDAPSGSMSINPDDVESISVLKGANASALYGSRAANGVILVTTKKGKNSKGFGVSVNSSFTWESPLKLPSFQNSYGQGGDDQNFYFSDGQNDPAGTDESWGMPLDVGINAVQFSTNGQSPEPWVSYPDNIKDFFDPGFTHSENFAITNGGEKGNFRLSFTNSNQKGIVPNTDFRKITINGAADTKLADKLIASVSVNYVKSLSDNLPTTGYNNENPVQQMIWSGRQVDFEKLRDYENLPLAAPGTAAAGTPLNWNTIFQNNPYWVQYTNLNTYEQDRVIGNFSLKYNVFDYLYVRVKSGIDYYSNFITENKAQGSNNAPFGSFRETFRDRYELNSEILIAFNKDITEDFNLSLNVGGNRQQQVYHRVIGFAPQLELNGVYNLSNVKSGVNVNLTNYNEETRINSVYLSGLVGFKRYLFLEFSARNDWSSVLPIENNSFFYPSISLSADITEMTGITNEILSFLKVRGSYAKVGGSTALSAYSLEQTYGFRTSPWGTTLLPFNSATLNNPKIMPETTTSLEFGVDARFFNGRLTADLTYYNSKSKDLIVPVQVSAASGYTQAYDNVGEMANSGFELQLGVDVLKTEDLVWNIGVNFAKYNNEVVSLGDLETLVLGGQWSMTLEARPGLPYGVIVGSAFERAPNGQVIYANGYPVLSTKNVVLGDIQPDWTGGFKSSVTYKGINLSLLIDAKMGGEVHSMSTTFGRYAGVFEETLEGRETGVVGPGVKMDASGNYVPNDVVVTSENFNKAAYNNPVTETGVFDASYMKLRALSLGYTLPKKLFGKSSISDVTISFVGKNLAILYSKAPHIDPETSFSSANGEQGQEFGQLPSTRSYGFNVNFKF